MRRILTLLLVAFVLLGFPGVVTAELTVIGTATYGESTYNLIYEKDAPFGPIVWLDYWNPGNPEIPGVGGNWDQQMKWVSNLGVNLEVNLFPGFNTDIDWATGWRLPKMVDGEHIDWCDGTTAEGYNITTGELGHLYYVSLKNEGAYDFECIERENWWPDGWNLINTGPFENLQKTDTWYETDTRCDDWIESQDCAWFFSLGHGLQAVYHKSEPGWGGYDFSAFGVAVRPAHVSISNLKVIGTATYLNNNYNLIYDKAQGLVWLDYTNPPDQWLVQMEWAKSLENDLNINIHSDYIDIQWYTEWRLPETVDGTIVFGDDGSTTAGFNIITSEMGYLRNFSLGNPSGWVDEDGKYTIPFENLQPTDYWSDTETNQGHCDEVACWETGLDLAWFFSFGTGWQSVYLKLGGNWASAWWYTMIDWYGHGIAVRPAHVPIPTYTNEGENVSVVEPINHGDTKSTVTITFDKVEDAGDTTLYILPIEDGNIPDGFEFGDFVFDIETTADFSDSVTVCINNPNVNESTRLWHRKCDECPWDDVTIYPIEGETICGKVDSFSLFAIGEYSAKNAIDILIGDVKSLNINKGIENSLIKKLEAANSSLNRNRKNAAANQIGAFINQVNGLKGKKISEGAASELIRKAEDIILYL